MHAFFVSDLHGSMERYEKLFAAIRTQKPGIVFIGGDLLNLWNLKTGAGSFIYDFLVNRLMLLKSELETEYPTVYMIPGNDDPRYLETIFLDVQKSEIWKYIHNVKVKHGKFSIYGYAYVPPTPFRLKDWERYDVSRYVDPGCISPTEGKLTVNVTEDIEYATIKEDLEKLVKDDDLSNSIFLFHSPPYQTNLDRAALDDVRIEHVPADVHVGSIAIRRMIEIKQPKITLHGHIHESSRITGEWKDKIGDTIMLSAAWHDPELALVEFDLDKPELASRRII